MLSEDFKMLCMSFQQSPITTYQQLLKDLLDKLNGVIIHHNLKMKIEMMNIKRIIKVSYLLSAIAE